MSKTGKGTRPVFQGTFHDLLNSDLELIISLLDNGDVSFTDKQYRDCVYSKFGGGTQSLLGSGSLGQSKDQDLVPPAKFKNWEGLFRYLYECRFLPLHTAPILLYISREGCMPCMRFNAIWEQLKDNKVIKKSVRCVKLNLQNNLDDLHPMLSESILQQFSPNTFGTPTLMCVEPRSFFSIFTCIDLIPFKVKNQPKAFYVREVYGYHADENLPEEFSLRMIPYGYVKVGSHYQHSNDMIFQFDQVYQWINDVKYDTMVLNDQAEHEALMGEKKVIHYMTF